MTLASIKSEHENAFVLRHLEREGRVSWLGGVRSKDDPNRFHWLGENTSWLPDNTNDEVYNNWESGEPTLGTEDCIEMIGNSGQWNDVQNTAELPFVCKA